MIAILMGNTGIVIGQYIVISASIPQAEPLPLLPIPSWPRYDLIGIIIATLGVVTLTTGILGAILSIILELREMKNQTQQVTITDRATNSDKPLVCRAGQQNQTYASQLNCDAHFNISQKG
jgi:hypothetical protein